MYNTELRKEYKQSAHRERTVQAYREKAKRQTKKRG